MSTRSCIAVDHGGIIKAIYCHWDGYLEGVGKTLLDHYTSPLANELVALGNLSILAAKIHPTEGVEHCFDTAEHGVCVFYDRDRQDDKLSVGFTTLGNQDELFVYFCKCEYFYLMRDDEWLVSTGGPFEPLQAALVNLWIDAD